MNKENIKAKANLMIGYANFERNEFMKKTKLKHVCVVAIALTVFISGMLTVNALTDNSIGNAITKTVENVLKIKVDGKDYNANCSSSKDGKFVCTVDSSVLGSDTEVTIEKPNSSNDDLQFEIKTTE